MRFRLDPDFLFFSRCRRRLRLRSRSFCLRNLRSRAFDFFDLDFRFFTRRFCRLKTVSRVVNCSSLTGTGLSASVKTFDCDCNSSLLLMSCCVIGMEFVSRVKYIKSVTDNFIFCVLWFSDLAFFDSLLRSLYDEDCSGLVFL